MTKTKWHTRAIYILVALALAIGLTGIAAAPEVNADPGLTEWDKVTTPSMDDEVITPEGNVLLFTVGMSDGLESLPETIYAMGSLPLVDAKSDTGTTLWKSTDSGATWTDKTDKIMDCIDDEGLGDLVEINFIAAALDDADFLAVAAYLEDGSTPSGYAQQVFISDDGATEFAWPGDLVDGASKLTDVFCLAVSDEVDGKRNIAAGGLYDPDGSMPMTYPCRSGYDEVGKVFRLETGGLFGSWKDATNPAAYPGWDDNGDFTSTAVTRVGFAPSWASDFTVLATTHTNEAWTAGPYCGTEPGATYLQSGTWSTNKGWNAEADFADAVLIVDDVIVNWPFGRAFICGFALPFDYEGRHSGDRYAWVYVDYAYDLDYGDTFYGEIFQVINDSVKPIEQQISGMPWMANLSYWGTIDSGKAIAGLIGNGRPGYDAWDFTTWFRDCCEGVQVYRNDSIEDMDICCKAWKEACKPPTGRFAVVAAFVSENKAYCVVGVHPALQVAYEGYYDEYDESAFSFSLDDGENWNQIGLIDTYIDYLSDVAVNPACNAIWLASINEYWGCGCDSVWYKADDLEEAEEYSGVWIREWSEALEGYRYDCSIGGPWEAGLLRLAPEETDESLTVYLVDRGTEIVYYNGSKGLTCWESGHSTIDEIGDLAVKDEATIYALSMVNGDVAFSDDHGAAATWEEAVDSEVDVGHTIAVHGDYVLVGGGYDEYCDDGGDASYSDDGGETFTALDDVGDDGDVHVAFDSYFDDNGTVYAALGFSDLGDDGIYRCSDLEAGEWDDINALPYDYTGIVLDRPDPGNPMTSAESGGVLYASAWDITWDGDEFVDPDDPGSWYSGAARCLTPAEDVCCGEESWDYLIQGLDAGPDEYFELQPSALKICGCLTEETNSHLWAIDDDWYEMSDGSDGTLWVWEDCLAKEAPTLTSPADDATMPADPCYCWNDEFVLKWERLCNACCYDIQIAYDEEFDEILPAWDLEMEEPPSPSKPSIVVENLGLGTGSCATTFYWRVRVANAESDEDIPIHSFWSDVRSFTVAQGPQAAIELTAPANGATNVATSGVSFTWSSVQDATSYDFTLSASSDLSSPIVSETGLTATAYTYTGTLSEDTPYYWQVNAEKDGRVISDSSIATFTTKPAAPPPPAEPATPIWVWVVIGIGAVLVIVVIVLIFRTRRV